MKIAVVGCGALGSYYGARLLTAAPDVHFLLRSDFQHVRENGVQIHWIQGDFLARPKCALEPSEIGPSDLVVIGLKTTANYELPRILPHLIHAKTAVLTLQNGLGNEEFISRIVGPEKVLGGLCFVCINRLAPGVIHHTAGGKIVMGEWIGPVRHRTREIAGLFNRSGVVCDVTDNIGTAHWNKLIWNIPFNGLGVASAAGYEAWTNRSGESFANPRQSCLTADQLLADPRWLALARALMKEVIEIARRLGHSISHEQAEVHIQRTYGMGAYKSSTLIDFELGRELELESIFYLPLMEAKKTGVEVPNLERLCQILGRLNLR